MPADDKTMLSAFELLQVHNVVTFESEEKIYVFIFLWTNITTLLFHDWINKLILKDNTAYTVLRCLYVADPATSLASKRMLRPYYHLGRAGS